MTLGAQLKQAKRPLASDDAPDHRGDREGRLVHRLVVPEARAAFQNRLYEGSQR